MMCKPWIGGDEFQNNLTVEELAKIKRAIERQALEIAKNIMAKTKNDA